MKIKCSHCHFETEFEDALEGTVIPCGSCGRTVSAKSGSGHSSQGQPGTGRSTVGSRAELVSSIVGSAALFARRIFKSNLYSERVSEYEEKVLMAATPQVTSPIAQSYLGWRRALLWFGGVCLAFSAVLGLIDLEEVFDEPSTPGIIQFVLTVFVLAKSLAAVLAIIAALQWDQILRTRMLARFSWFCIFFVPLLVGLIPMSYFIDLKKSGLNQAMVSFQFGLFYFILLTPTLLGLFPGIVRSALTLKTMLPESQMPGWVALIIAPLYALFLAIGLVIAAQAQDFLTLATIVAFGAAPVFVVVNGRRLITPAAPEQMLKNIRRVKGQMTLAYGSGVVLATLLALRFLNKVDVSFLDVASFVAAILANLFMVTVVVSDLMLTFFKDAFSREIHLREEGLLDSLVERFADLDQIGLTKFTAGEMDFVKGVGDRVRQIGGSDENP